MMLRGTEIRFVRFMWYVYILECCNHSLYTGISTDVAERIKIHNAGKGSRYTRVWRPVELLYVEGCSTRKEAAKRELEVKKLSKESKRRLIKYGPGRRFPSPHNL